MPHSEPVLWELSYQAVLNESDPEQLKQRVLDAEWGCFSALFNLTAHQTTKKNAA